MTSDFGEERQKNLSGYPVMDAMVVREGEPLTVKLRLGPGGRVVIPAAMREKLKVAEGDALMATFMDGELRLVSIAESVRRAQAIVRSKVPAGVSLVDELLADRQREVLAERKNG
ncbi:MAG: AbrB/MazE/SpoVT family DNA-binding domain-containing protein [Hyphomicrobiaceae bacterium]